MDQIKYRLQELRLKHDITIASLVRYLGITRQTYYSYESGKVVPALDKLIKLSQFYSVSLDYLVGRVDESTYKSVEHAEFSSFLMHSGYQISDLKVIFDLILKIKSVG